MANGRIDIDLRRAFHGIGGIGSTLARIWRLWGVYTAMDVLLLTRNLKMVITWYIADTILGLAAITATLLLAERFEGIGAWTRFQIIFMLGYTVVITGIANMLFGYNILLISRRLGRGQFDHTLIQPQPIWMALLTEGFMPLSSLATLLPGIGLMVWAISNLAMAISPGWLLLLALYLVASVAIMASFSFLWGSLAFWAPRAAEEVSSSAVRLLHRLQSFPLDGLGPALLGPLLTVLPVGFIAWYPCRYLLGIDNRPWAGVVTPLAALAITTMTTFIFMKGMQQYGRTGSQRYNSLGHRR